MDKNEGNSSLNTIMDKMGQIIEYSLSAKHIGIPLDSYNFYVNCEQVCSLESTENS